ncbi:MAG: carbohydrate kinase family protein, partial [Lachnospiraceae bacterium]|nr:carbohydrate kinase family protein [Lachnospiraceae bacterium]
GSDVELVSKTGADRAGDQILEFLRAEGIGHRGVSRDPALSTSVNIVLVDGRGERYFLTSPDGSLRRLEAKDILPFLDTAADIVSFTGVFVSPLLTIPAMTGIFERIRRVPGRILAADMTKAKHGERLQDLEPMLRYVDYIFPNEAEIALLTGEEDPRKNAELLVRAGVRCAVIKRGGKGCLVCDGDTLEEIPAYPVSSAVDSTGAGDAFVAGFLRGLQSGYTARECAVLGNAAASCVVECMGATEGFWSAEKAYKRFEEMMACLGK